MKKLICLGIVVLAAVPAVSWGKIGGGDIVFKPSGAGTVVYSHDIHVGRLGLKCKECHPGIFAMADGYGKTTMASMETGKSCGTCHNGKRAFSVKGNACGRCHQ